MQTSELIINAFENKTPVHLGALSWPEFLEMLKYLKAHRK